jgi:hypothetical protein
MFRVTVGDGKPLVDRQTSLPTPTEYYELTLRTDLPRYVAIARRDADSDDAPGATTDSPDDVANDARAVTLRAHKRYSEFETLHRVLTEQGAQGKYQARLPSMPKKALVRTPAVRETRKEGFQFILDAIGRDRDLRECDEVVAFFASGDRFRRGLRTTGSANEDAGEDAERREGAGANGTVDGDADDDDEDDDDDAPVERRGGTLESLLQSTMRVHGKSEAWSGRGEEAPRVDDSIGSAFEEEEMRETTTQMTQTTTQTTTVLTSSLMLNRSTLLMPNNIANATPGSVSYEFSSAGAREAIKANDTLGLERLLDEHSVEVNVKDNSGMTLLHLACLLNRKHAVDALLRRGADATLRNAQGETASELAPPTLAYTIAKALKNS